MKFDFRRAKKILNTNAGPKFIIAVNGCCYGEYGYRGKLEYLKLCGQACWELISGESELYRNLIFPLGHKSAEKNHEFNSAFGKVADTFSPQFSRQIFSGKIIEWEWLVFLNSASQNFVH